MEIEDLKKKVIKDGRIDDSEVTLIKEYIDSEGGMNKELGNFLFELKNSASKGKLPSSFKNLFVDEISALLLEDEISPGEIDDDEAKWLRAKIQYNGKIDEYDSSLLENLKEKSINFPKILQYKSLRAREFEKILYSSRYLSLLAVIGSLISAIFLFCEGVYVIWFGLKNNFFVNQVIEDHKTGKPKVDYEQLFEAMVSSVDIFLFALVLIIFSVGVYELFVSKIDPIEQNNDSRPSWLRISSVDDLKGSLGKVILMVLIVSFFKHILEFDDWTSVSFLYLAIGIFLIAGALYLTHKSHDTNHNHKHEE